MRKLRCAAEAAVGLVKHFHGRFDDFLNYLRRKLASFAGEGFSIRDRTLDHLCLLEHIAILLVISVGDRQQHAPKTRTSGVIIRRKVSAAIKRTSVGCEKAGERPATLARNRLHRDLIAAVDVGALI